VQRLRKRDYASNFSALRDNLGHAPKRRNTEFIRPEQGFYCAEQSVYSTEQGAPHKRLDQESRSGCFSLCDNPATDCTNQVA
jgi:hypothetical protein